MKLDPGLRVLLIILAALVGVAFLLGVWFVILAPPGFEPAALIPN